MRWAISSHQRPVVPDSPEQVKTWPVSGLRSRMSGEAEHPASVTAASTTLHATAALRMRYLDPAERTFRMVSRGGIEPPTP